ncbi:MAG TPA: hypothetical protein VGD31_00480 [Sphingobacteriaceae bacterium]
MLWHKFGLNALSPEKRERTGTAGNDPEEWKRTVLATEGGQLYLEPSYIFAAIRDGAKYTSRKRGTLQPLVVATLQVLDDRILIDRFLPDPMTSLSTSPDASVYLDVRGVKNPATKGRNVRYRVAASPGWQAAFTIFWDKTLVSRGEMEAAIIDAGRFVGVGNGRAIGFGRFIIEACRVEDAREGS